MLYVTIIVIAILITGCIITCNYFKHTYNPNMFESGDPIYKSKLQDINIICNTVIEKLNFEKLVDEENKYSVDKETLIEAIDNIEHMTSIALNCD